MIQSLVKVVDTVLRWLVILLMGISVLNVLWQVLSRYVLRQPSSWTEELARYMLIWVSLFGGAYAVRLKMHLAIDLISERVSPQSRLYIQGLIQLCVALFALLVMTVGGMRLVSLTHSLNQISAALQVKLAYMYAALPISGLLILFYSIVNLWEIYERARLKEPVSL